MTVPVVVHHKKNGKVVVDTTDIEQQQQKLYQLVKTGQNNEYTLGEIMDVHYEFFSTAKE